MGRGRPLAAVLLVLAGVRPSATRAAEPPDVSLDPARVAWRALYYTAHKMGISASIAVRMGGPGVPEGRSGGGEAAVAGDGIVLESTTHLPGRVFLAREEVDPVQARALSIVDTETGAKNHRKTYTLTTRGFFLDLLEPASRAQAAKPPERWTQATRSFTGYPRALPPAAPITGPIGLLYAMSAAPLKAPGDAFTVHVLVQTNVERVTVQVESVETVALDFRETSGGVERAVVGPISALRLVVRSRPVDPAATSAFRIFGLGGDVELLWDPARHLPVEIAGSVRVLGRVKVHLASVTMR